MRRSSRTGQVHPIGGFIGEAEYEGELTRIRAVSAGCPVDGRGEANGLG